MFLISPLYNVFEQTNIMGILRGQHRMGAFHNMVLGRISGFNQRNLECSEDNCTVRSFLVFAPRKISLVRSYQGNKRRTRGATRME
jgi:hypothetical protein